ncbi:MAG TPA: hypothetical protein VNN77_12330 [candidate division Zixibacteria bacterium]|nr:hypothetical protein [candidate division Zixibacteria bacterium]
MQVLAKAGYLIWETINLGFIALMTVAFIRTRRRLQGRPVFTEGDLELFFGPRRPPVTGIRFWVRFAETVVLCCLMAATALQLFDGLGAALLTGMFLVAAMGVVKTILLG